jgi:hypothetical protein
MVSSEAVTRARMDLAASNLLVWRLIAQGRRFSAAQRESVLLLRQQLCDAPWSSADERDWAQVLVLRLELLLLGPAKAPSRPVKLSGLPPGRDGTPGGRVLLARRSERATLTVMHGNGHCPHATLPGRRAAFSKAGSIAAGPKKAAPCRTAGRSSRPMPAGRGRSGS